MASAYPIFSNFRSFGAILGFFHGFFDGILIGVITTVRISRVMRMSLN